MYETHPLFEPPTDPNTKIWRFINIQKFSNLLKHESLHFSKVTSFEDPFEGTVPEFNKKNAREVYAEKKNDFANEEQFEKFLRNKEEMDNKVYEMLKNQLLVNCWHINEHESASMWKLYTSNFDGVVIQSTYKKLKESFDNNFNDKVWIGKVNYSDYSKEWQNEWNAYSRFISKRISFECESELRLITSLPEDMEQKKLDSSNSQMTNNELTPNGKFVKVNLDHLVENIYLAPFSSNDFFDIINSIAEKFQPNLINKIKKSNLYSLQ